MIRCALTVWLLCLTVSSLKAGDWPQFLGPGRTGISQETGLLGAFPASGPKELWRVPGGVGMSNVSVAGNQVVTLVQKQGRQWIVALDAKTGQEAWASDLAAAYENSMGDGPRATPTIQDGVAYAYTGEGVLAAVDMKSGDIRWSHNVPVELKTKPSDYGMSCSPLVTATHVIIAVGAEDATIAAFEIAGGKLVWTAGQGSAAGYSSPALLQLAGESQLVAFAGNQAMGVDPQTGKLLWSYPYETDFSCNTATPVAVEGNLFLSAGENHGCVMLKVPAKAGGKVEELWSSQGAKSVMRNEWQTSVLIDGYLYGFDNVGSAGPVTHLTCVNAKTGERVWQKLRFGKGNLIAADGKLWCSTMAGDLVLVRATPDKYEELSRATVIGETRQAPVIAQGRLYLRDGAEIVCLDIARP
jgi:outer membrane protein assembly factor BamB